MLKSEFRKLLLDFKSMIFRREIKLINDKKYGASDIPDRLNSDYFIQIQLMNKILSANNNVGEKKPILIPKFITNDQFETLIAVTKNQLL